MSEKAAPVLRKEASHEEVLLDMLKEGPAPPAPLGLALDKPSPFAEAVPNSTPSPWKRRERIGMRDERSR